MDRPQDVADVLKGAKDVGSVERMTCVRRFWATLILRKCASIWRRWAALI